MTEPGPELRLALAMRGGVSLAVWMGGACAEIDALRRAGDLPTTAGDDAATAFWRASLAEAPFSRVTVDVIAGASAGGLNGVMFGAAIRHGFSMADLLDVWRRVAGVDVLRRRTTPWRSLFDGDARFLDVIDQRLTELVGATPSHPPRSAAALDLQLTATLVEPVSQPAISPSDETLRRSRSAARFHFRHDPHATFPRADLERRGLARLAVAARSSASFPFAFEASTVRSTRTTAFDVGPIPDPVGTDDPARRRLVDCRGIFSESRGTADERSLDLHDDDFVVADGGILDNIPIARALEAIGRMPATGPTRRVLVYLHPTGPPLVRSDAPERPRSAHDRRGARALVKGLIASRLEGESIDEDLELLEAANRNLRLRRQARLAAAGRSDDPADLLAEARVGIGSYREQRAVVDADEVRALLHDPLAVLGEDPFPLAPGGGSDDRWRSPLAQWAPQHRLELDEVLRSTFRGRLEERAELAPLLNGGLGPLARTIALLTELALAIEAGTTDDAPRVEVGACKGELYRLGSLVRELERIRRIGWVTSAGRLIEPSGATTIGGGAGGPGHRSVGAWVAGSLDDLNGLLECERAEAELLCAPPGEASFDAVAAARHRLVDRCNRGLHGLATPGPTPPRPRLTDPVDLRDAVTAELGRLADDLVARWPYDTREATGAGTTSPSADLVAGAELVRRVLQAPPPAPTAPGAVTLEHGERFAALEVLLVREHLLGSTPGVDVSFVRMSAAAPTIDARRFVRLHEVSARLDPEHTDDHHLRPEVKLAGNELSNFAAFIDERWRTNDWFWGRMDAVPTLVDLLLGTDQADADRRRALIRRRQDDIVEEMFAAFGSAGGESAVDARARWNVGLETLTVPGSRAARRSMAHLARVATVVAGAGVGRPRLAWVLQFPVGWFAGRAARPRGGPAGGRRRSTGRT